MFRKEYKQANDNIKVDEALLERTIEAAFAEKPKKKTYYHRSFAPVAAALVIVIGASAAYPKLTEKPQVEQSVTAIVTSTISPTINPHSELKFEAIPEVTSEPIKNVKASRVKPSKNSTVKNVVANTEEPRINQDANSVVEDVAYIPSGSETVEAVSDALVLPSVARAVTGEIEAYNAPEQSEERFIQISCNFSDGVSEYVYENQSGKSFIVTVIDCCDESVSGLSVERNGKFYVFSSQNMTDAEILEVFETLNI